MGQQESTYRKFDASSRRRNVKVKVPEAQNENDKENAHNEDEKVKAKIFPLNLAWKPKTLVLNNSIEANDLPGWFHGWCTRNEVGIVLNQGSIYYRNKPYP